MDSSVNHLDNPNKPESLPLSALLSQVLVAFTIELDNEFEHRMPHRTSNFGATEGAPFKPWLVSMVMWFNCMQFVDGNGITIAELIRKTRAVTNFRGMARWGYISIKPAAGDERPKPPSADLMVKAKPAGLLAKAIWAPLFGEIEGRWHQRFGATNIKQLKEALLNIENQLEFDLPDCLPILGYGLYSTQRKYPERSATSLKRDENLPLPVLLSRVLLAFALAFERGPGLSLAISANVLRVIDEFGVNAKNLPQLSGVSKEAISMAMGVLQKKGLIIVGTLGRNKVVGLNDKGLIAQQAYHHGIAYIESQFSERFGNDGINNLRQSLEGLLEAKSKDNPLLFTGIEPYPDGWRAFVRKPHTLPHYPMVLHRGGYPDGS